MLAPLHRRHAGLSPLPVRPRVCHPAEGPSVFLWGVASGHWIALCSAALAAAKGLQVAAIDATAAFQAPSPVAAEACRVPPGTLLRPVTVARAFT
jgi:hypothetical protein